MSAVRLSPLQCQPFLLAFPSASLSFCTSAHGIRFSGQTAAHYQCICNCRNQTRDDDVTPYLIHTVKGSLKSLNLNLYILPTGAGH